MMTTSVRRIAVAGLALMTLVGVASCSSTESTVKADVKKVDRALHDGAVRAYDDAKKGIETAGDKIGDGSRDVYDKTKSGLDSIGSDLDKAGRKTGDEAKRAYRDVQHHLDSLDRDVDRHLHKAGNDLGDAEYDAWGDVKDGVHHTRDAIDHVIDKL